MKLKKINFLLEKKNKLIGDKFRIFLYFNSHGWIRKFICKKYHKKYHKFIEWDTGHSKTKKIFCDYCESHFESFLGGSCLTCNNALLSAFFIKQCSECKSKGINY